MTTAEYATIEQWREAAVLRFGADPAGWRFVCPACGYVATAREWRAAGAPDEAIAFSCVGRWLPTRRDAFDKDGPGPCNYAGGGLFALNPVRITDASTNVFAFAPD